MKTLSTLLVLCALVLAFLQFGKCSTEDSTLCYWNASTQGNGEGISFLALTDDIYITFK